MSNLSIDELVELERAAEIAELAMTIQRLKDTIVRQYSQDHPEDALVYALDFHMGRLDELVGVKPTRSVDPSRLTLITGGA